MPRTLRHMKPLELNLLPIMNLFSVLIPFLISVASFQKIALVDLEIPPRSPTATENQVEGADLQLTVTVSDAALQIWSARGALPPIAFRETWQMRCEGETALREYPAHSESDRLKALRCADGTAARVQDVENIVLTAVDTNGQVVNAWVHEQLGLLSTVEGQPLTSQNKPLPGAILIAGGKEIRWDPREDAAIKKVPVNAYDMLGNLLYALGQRHADAPDAGMLTVVADNAIVTDKVIHVMDAAHDNGFAAVSLAKIGG